ncbi:MAG TPA: hypothetical protein VFQ39_13670 [Longimicrobium sp.]|nr:hypothetical protein [Longimicrobium sp.]
MSRKLKLEIDNLSVESFDVTRAPASERGTVLARSEPGSDSYGEDTCGWTCGIDCDRTMMLCYTQLNCASFGGGGGGTTRLTENDGGIGTGC